MKPISTKKAGAVFSVFILLISVLSTLTDGLSAENSWVTLPAPFSLTAPTNGEIFALDDVVVFEWTPVDENSKIAVSSTKAGTINSNFGEGGRIIAKQSRTLEIRYNPDGSATP